MFNVISGIICIVLWITIGIIMAFEHKEYKKDANLYVTIYARSATFWFYILLICYILAQVNIILYNIISYK